MTAEPEIPDHIEIPIPGVGPVKVVGRDLLLAITLLIVGAAACVVITVMWRGFQRSLDGAVVQALGGLDKASGERERIEALLRLQVCQAEFRKGLAPELVDRWRHACVGEVAR